MNDQPAPAAGDSGTTSHPDPLDRETDPGTAPDTSHGESPPDPAAASDWEETRTYAREAEARPGWSPGWREPSGGSDWASARSGPAWSSPPAQPAAVTVQPARRSPSLFGPIVLVAVIAASLASGGTYLALSASGALDRSATPATTGADTIGVRQPITIDESSAIVEAAAKVSPAVVRITVQGTDPEALGEEIPSTGVGSGVIFDSNGWILTNRHVVTGGTKFTVQLKDGQEFEGRVYGVDTLTDLAIVKIDATGLPTAPIGDSGDLKVGQLTIAIGSPLGTYSNSVTSGIVSAKGRQITVESGDTLSNLIQTDAAINPGNSGGPLLDGGGNVIGINTAVARNSNGIGFAIPINLARPILQQALAGQPLARPYIGVTFVKIDAQLAKDLDLPVKEGALVELLDAQGRPTGEPAVKPGSPGARAGIGDRDIIVSIEGVAIDTDHPLDLVLSQFSPGQMVSVGILRDGQRQTVSITLGTRPDL